jgi:hypothetical protein
MVWGFLSMYGHVHDLDLLLPGFCALVVVVIQCVPAIIMLYGMIKGSAFVAKDEMVKVKKQQGRINEER